MFGYDWVRNKNFCLAMKNISAAYSTTTMKYLFQYTLYLLLVEKKLII